MAQHYCPDCQAVCTCEATDVLDCEHPCPLEDLESLGYKPPPLFLKRRWPWNTPEVRDDRETW